MEFLNEQHKERFEELMKRGKISNKDIERTVPMYIISGNQDLYSRICKMYDFKENQFIFDFKEEDDEKYIAWNASLSSSQEKLMLLAFSLFSGRSHVGVVELFRSLDSTNKELAMNAIKYFY